MKAFEAILTYIAVKKLITFVVLAAMMIGLLAVVCVTAFFVSNADTNDNSYNAAVLNDNSSDTLDYTYFNSGKLENLKTVDVLGP